MVATAADGEFAECVDTHSKFNKSIVNVVFKPLESLMFFFILFIEVEKHLLYVCCYMYCYFVLP